MLELASCQDGGTLSATAQTDWYQSSQGTEFDRNYLDAETACAWGLVNKVVSADELLPTCEQLARDIASTEPVTRAEIRRIMDEGWAATLSEGLGH